MYRMMGQNVVVTPSGNDVLLGRGKANRSHPGNQRFEDLVDKIRESYQKATSRQEKVHITQSVIVQVRNGGGWFLRYDEDRRGWLPIDDQSARKKVSQAIQYRRRRSTSDPTNAYDDFFESESAKFSDEQQTSTTHTPTAQSALSFPIRGQVWNEHFNDMLSPNTYLDDDIVSDQHIYEALGIPYESISFPNTGNSTTDADSKPTSKRSPR